jgi:hypothetical protein
VTHVSGETTLARAEIKKHLEEIRMTPQYGEGKPAEGAWNLLGKETGPSHNTAPLPIRMVAAARYVPNRQFLSIPFRSDLIHCPA